MRRCRYFSFKSSAIVVPSCGKSIPRFKAVHSDFRPFGKGLKSAGLSICVDPACRQRMTGRIAVEPVLVLRRYLLDPSQVVSILNLFRKMECARKHMQSGLMIPVLEEFTVHLHQHSEMSIDVHV